MSNFRKNGEFMCLFLLYLLLVFIITVASVVFKLNVQMLESRKFYLVISNVSLSCH